MNYQRTTKRSYPGSLELTCKVCNNVFLSFPSDKRKYCSKACYLRNHRAKVKKCIRCQKEFKKPGDPNQKYCSRKCYLLDYHTSSFTPNYNKKGCEVIEEYGLKHGYNFQHAENGGEVYLESIGYWLDGYDREKNVVVEYMEKYHRYRTKKDSTRKKEIIELLGCKFIEIWE